MRKPPSEPPPLRVFLLALFLTLTGLLTAQNGHRERGIPFTRYFPAREYKAHTQNFASTQDERGVHYVANFAGILEYDGVSWRLIRTANQSKVSALCTDSRGRVFAGARGEIGYLAPDRQGMMAFTDLTGLIPEAYRKFTEVLSCYASGAGIYFVTSSSVMIYHEGKVTTIPFGQEILSAFHPGGSLYLQVKDMGLMKLEGTQKIPVTGSEIFTAAIQVTSLFPFRENTLLAATDNQGLYIIDPKGVKPFITDADNQLRSARITCGIRLGNHEMVFGTLRNGLFLFSEEGKLLGKTGKSMGLGDDYVNHLFIDRYNGIWACLNDGLARVEYPSPFLVFDASVGLKGGVTGIARFRGRLFVSTYQGLYRYEPAVSGFVALPQVQFACWALLPLENMLLAATTQGLYRVDGDQATRIAEGFFLSLLRSPADPSVIWGGKTSGIAVLEYRQGTITCRGDLREYQGDGREMAAGREGRLWIIDPDRGLHWLDPGGVVTLVDRLAGLPDIRGMHLSPTEKDLFFTSPSGVYVFEAASSSFRQHPLSLPDSAGNARWFYRLSDDRRGGYWATAGDEKQLCRLLPREKGWVCEEAPFLPVADRTVWTRFCEENGVSWFGGPEGLLRFDPSVRMVYERDVIPLIREMTLNNDTTVFNGAFSTAEGIQSVLQPAEEIPVFRHWENTIRLKFAAPLNDAGGVVHYRYILDGFDKLWSDWTTETQKEYTNLPGGKYTFRIQVRDVYGKVSQVSAYTFQIRKAWYLTRGALAACLLLLGAVIFLFIRWRSEKLIREKRALEELIREKTAEVVEQKEEIEQASRDLAFKNEELERINNVVKSINAQINFTSLLESILQKMMVVRGVEKATALVLDKSSGHFRYQTGLGWDMHAAAHREFTQDELKSTWLAGTKELTEDIFIPDPDRLQAETGDASSGARLVIVIRIDDQINGLLVLETSSKKFTFDERDLSFIVNLRQHLISAFIKTGLLEELQSTLNELKSAQDQLIQSEKLASLGQLTAGIAHEIQNPLNFVINFANLSERLAGELKENIDKIREHVDEDIRLDMEDIAGMIGSNVQKIKDHGKRAESIVKGMLQHSRGRSGEFEPVDVNNMVSEYVNLAYHGMRAKDKSFNTAIVTDFDENAGKVSMVPQDISRVILNLMNNACYAVDQRAKSSAGSGYRPEITVSTRRKGKQVEIRMRDNGTGIPKSVVDKIFNPFFTTKPTGQGTGLGLSMSFDIISQIHKGKLEVNTEEGEFTEFIITLPENPPS